MEIDFCSKWCLILHWPCCIHSSDTIRVSLWLNDLIISPNSPIKTSCTAQRPKTIFSTLKLRNYDMDIVYLDNLFALSDHYLTVETHPTFWKGKKNIYQKLMIAVWYYQIVWSSWYSCSMVALKWHAVAYYQIMMTKAFYSECQMTSKQKYANFAQLTLGLASFRWNIASRCG